MDISNNGIVLSNGKSLNPEEILEVQNIIAATLRQYNNDSYDKKTLTIPH